MTGVQTCALPIYPAREASLIDERVRDNPGPLSDEGMRSFYVELLALIKRELET